MSPKNSKDDNFPDFLKLSPELQKVVSENNRTPSAWKNRQVRLARKLRSDFRLPEEIADAIGEKFSFDPASLARIDACIDALEDAIIRGNAIRRHPMEQDGNVIFM